MKEKLKIGAIIAAIAMIVMIGCAPKDNAEAAKGSNAKYPVTITDVFGSKVTIDKEPERIVALAPSTVEVLYELGLGDKIVGLTEYCDYPSEAKSKPKLGDFNGVNIEKIIEAKPDLIFAGTGMSKQEFQKLNDLKFKVIVTEAETVSQIPETFMMIGKAVNRKDEAKSLADKVTAKINDIKAKTKDVEKVKTYYVLSYGKAGNWTAGKGTFISDLINIAGGENVSDDIDGWKEYSLEKIVEKDPDLILVSDMIANGNKNLLDNENGYKDTSAVKNKRVAILDDDLTQRPGPRIVEGIELIAKAIHPEIFGK